jgi:hypothetical protein
MEGLVQWHGRPAPETEPGWRVWLGGRDAVALETEARLRVVAQRQYAAALGTEAGWSVWLSGRDAGALETEAGWRVWLSARAGLSLGVLPATRILVDGAAFETNAGWSVWLSGRAGLSLGIPAGAVMVPMDEEYVSRHVKGGRTDFSGQVRKGLLAWQHVRGCLCGH